MAQSFELACMNTSFQRLDKHLTYVSAGVKSLMDYIMVKGRDKGEVIDCKVILGKACIKQHQLDFKMRCRKLGERKRRSKLK